MQGQERGGGAKAPLRAATFHGGFNEERRLSDSPQRRASAVEHGATFDFMNHTTSSQSRFRDAAQSFDLMTPTFSAQSPSRKTKSPTISTDEGPRPTSTTDRSFAKTLFLGESTTPIIHTHSTLSPKALGKPSLPQSPMKQGKPVIRMTAEGKLVASPSQSTPSRAADLGSLPTSPGSGVSGPSPTRQTPVSPRRMKYDDYMDFLRSKDKALGAHYRPIPGELPEHVDDQLHQAQADHDALLAENLHRRRPSDEPHPASGSPRVAMRIAFTDRAGRLREGRGARAALMKDDEQTTDWAAHGDCVCEVCKPARAETAGSPSHLTCKNRVPPYAKNELPIRPFWEQSMTKTFNSDLLRASLSPRRDCLAAAKEEDDFTTKLGRKGRSPERERERSPGCPLGLGVFEEHRAGSSGVLPHRSGSPDPAARAAGCYNQGSKPDIGLSASRGRQQFQGTSSDLGTRSGVAMVLSPRSTDPLAPLKICSSLKGEGAFKSKFSGDTDKIVQYQNQEVFRYADPSSIRKVIVDSASLVVGNSHAGLSTKDATAIEDRRDVSSPGLRTRTAMNNTSHRVSGVLDQARIQGLLDRETADRHATDKHFAKMCEYTRSAKSDARAVAAEVKQLVGHTHSEQVKANLTWIEAD